MKKFTVVSFILATIGSLSLALAVALFYDPNNIAAGGITGAAVILSHTFPQISTGTFSLLINIPLLILAALRFGKKFALLTVYSTVIASAFMNIFSPLAASVGTRGYDLLISALCGAVLDAIGLGLVYRAGGCTGGTDIVIKFLRQKYRHIRTGGMSLIINIAVVAASLAVFGDIRISVYSAIAIVVSSFILDKVLYGGEGAKLVFIISNKQTEITAVLLEEIKIGVTLLHGAGAYSHTEKDVIFCAVKKSAFTKLRDVVKSADADAFMIISSATEIFGVGYKNQFSDEI